MISILHKLGIFGIIIGITLLISPTALSQETLNESPKMLLEDSNILKANYNALVNKAEKDGIFVGFKLIRDSIYKKHKGMYKGIEMFANKFENLWYAGNTNGFTEVANKDIELLGIIYYYKKWKKWVWEQSPRVVMAQNCLKKVDKIIELVKKEGGRNSSQD